MSRRVLAFVALALAGCTGNPFGPSVVYLQHPQTLHVRKCADNTPRFSPATTLEDCVATYKARGYLEVETPSAPKPHSLPAGFGRPTFDGRPQ